ncbi:calcium-binding protein [Thermoleptolyngbya sp.]
MARIIGSSRSERIWGTNSSDSLLGLGGNDVLTGSVGNDEMLGGDGFDTADYSRMGRAMTLLPGGLINKGGLGIDRLSNVEQVIGATGFANTIDGSSGRNASFDVNLGANRLTVNNVPFLGTLTFSMVNFVNVRGTQNGDRIVGNNGANLLDGQGGNDVLIGSGGSDRLVGGTGIDILNGAGAGSRGFLEVDILTGGLGQDGFILGDRAGSYYRAGGIRDYALITDFTPGDLIQLGAGETYQFQRNANGFGVFVFRNGVADLIADVRTTTFVSLPNGPFRLASGQVFTGFIGA